MTPFPPLRAACAAAIVAATILITAAAPAHAAAPVRSYKACQDRVASDPHSAREAAAEWLRFGDGGLQARICEATALAALGAHASAAARLDVAARGAPPELRGELWALAAEFWLAGGRDKDALASAEAALEAAAEGAPARAGALKVRGLLRLAEGRNAAAAVDFGSALSLAPADLRPELLAARARARNALGEPRAALADAEAAVTAAPDMAAAWAAKGRAETLLGRADAARESYLRAIREDGPAPGGASADEARQALQAEAYGE